MWAFLFEKAMKVQIFRVVNRRLFYEKCESKFEEGEGAHDTQQIEEDLFNHIIWAPKIWRSCVNLFDCNERPT